MAELSIEHRPAVLHQQSEVGDCCRIVLHPFAELPAEGLKSEGGFHRHIHPDLGQFRQVVHPWRLTPIS